MDQKVSPTAPQFGEFQRQSPTRSGFTTQRLSLIVENRKQRKTWQKPQMESSGRKPLSRRSSLRSESSCDEDEETINESKKCSNTHRLPTRRNISAQYSSTPDLSSGTNVQMTSANKVNRSQTFKGLNGMSVTNDRSQGSSDTGVAMEDVGRRAYYRTKRAKRSPTSRKFDQLLNGDISSSLEALNNLVTHGAYLHNDNQDVEERTRPSESTFSSHKLNSTLDTKYSAKVVSHSQIDQNVSNFSVDVIRTSSGAKNLSLDAKLSESASNPGDFTNSQTNTSHSNRENNLNSKHTVMQGNYSKGGHDLSAVESKSIQVGQQKDISNPGNISGGEAEASQSSPDSSGPLSSYWPVMNTNMITKVSSDGKVPASLPVLHNETTCLNQSDITKHLEKSDFTHGNNADQSDVMCSNSPARKSQSDANYLANSSKGAKERPSEYYYDGSLASDNTDGTKQKSAGRFFNKKGPSIFGGFSRLFSRKSKSEKQTSAVKSSSNSRQSSPSKSDDNRSVESTSYEDYLVIDSKPVVKDDTGASLSVGNKDNTPKQESNHDDNRHMDSDLSDKDSDTEDKELTTEETTRETHQGDKEADSLSHHSSKNSLDSLEDEIFSPNPDMKDSQQSIEEDTRQPVKPVRRSQSVRDFTETEKQNVQQTGNITGFSLSKTFFQSPVGRSAPLLPNWRRWASHSNFEALREESEAELEASQFEVESESDSEINGAENGKPSFASDEKNSEEVEESGITVNPDVKTDSESEDGHLEPQFLDYFNRDGKVAIQTDGNKTVVIQRRGSFRNISYNPVFTSDGLKIQDELSRSELSSLDLPPEDRPPREEEPDPLLPHKHKLVLPDATTDESTDVQYVKYSHEPLDINQNTKAYLQVDDIKDKDEDSLFGAGSTSDLSYRSSETSENDNVKGHVKPPPVPRERSNSDYGLKGYMYNPKRDPLRYNGYRYHTQSNIDLRFKGVDSESETSSIADSCTSRDQGYSSGNRNASMDDIRNQLASMSTQFSSHIK